MPILVPVRVCYVYNLLTLQYPQFCTQLMKAYMAETSCNQLLLIDYSATYMLIKICFPVASPRRCADHVASLFSSTCRATRGHCLCTGHSQHTDRNQATHLYDNTDDRHSNRVYKWWTKYIGSTGSQNQVSVHSTVNSGRHVRCVTLDTCQV